MSHGMQLLIHVLKSTMGYLDHCWILSVGECLHPVEYQGMWLLINPVHLQDKIYSYKVPRTHETHTNSEADI